MAIDNFAVPEELIEHGWISVEECQRKRLQDLCVTRFTNVLRLKVSVAWVNISADNTLGIRLSDKTSCLRPRKIACQHRQLDETQTLVKILVGKAVPTAIADLVFMTQPSA